MRLRLTALFLVATSCAVSVAAAASGGRPEVATARVQAISVAAQPTARIDRCPIPGRFRDAFVTAANDTNLPLALLAAVAHTESRFQADATSSAGARGLLQVMPTTAAQEKVKGDDPASNVLAGARYLRRLLDRFASTDLALAAYNAGPTAVARTGGAPNGQTLTYVENVTDTWRLLHGCS